MAADDRVLTVNGGSSTIKFAAYAGAGSPRLLLKGQAEVSDEANAADTLIDRIEQAGALVQLSAIGHRVVHGGVSLRSHQLITPELIDELRSVQCLDLAHLPREIELMEAFRERLPQVKQFACFDTAFHRELPRTAQLLPIPRRYSDEGVRRLGFHGLSYTYLMQELRRVAGPLEASGRVILAHLGSGASMAAVHRGKPIDTSMAFTPAAGLMMGTRPGDMDPGLLIHLMRAEKLSPEQMDDFISRRCGLAGVSGGVPDIRELTARRSTDLRAAEALDLFCYTAKKWLGAFAAALGGLDTVVFSGGIGEHSAEVRAGICGGLEFLGLRLEESSNLTSAPVISSLDSKVTVRVIPTDEESIMAKIAFDLLMENN